MDRNRAKRDFERTKLSLWVRAMARHAALFREITEAHRCSRVGGTSERRSFSRPERSTTPISHRPRGLCVCRLNAKRPRGFPAGAIRTVDFLLHDLARIVKKVGVKTKDRALGRALINVQMSGFGGLSGNVLFGPSITVFDPKRTSLLRSVNCAQSQILASSRILDS